MYSYGPQHMAVQKQDDQHEHTFSNYVRIRDVVQKTCLIGKSGERGSGISVLPAPHDDDDDDDYIRNTILLYNATPEYNTTMTESSKDWIRNTSLHCKIQCYPTSLRLICIFTILCHMISRAQFISTVVFVALRSLFDNMGLYQQIILTCFVAYLEL